MDLDTENRIAAILMKEARDLRRQAENEGSLAYLRKPTLRSKPNSRFLTATVLGVQQANRSVEVNELWRLREKQVELENRLEGRRNGGRGRSEKYYKDVCESRSYRGRGEAEPSESASHASKKRYIDDLHSTDDEGLRDEDMEEFLHARTKRGRGAVGSRVDETGPYLPPSLCSTNADEEPRSSRAPLGPAKPSYLKSSESSDDESLISDKKKAKVRSSKKHSKRHKSERKSKEDGKKKRRREEEKKKKKRKHRD